MKILCGVNSSSSSTVSRAAIVPRIRQDESIAAQFTSQGSLIRVPKGGFEWNEFGDLFLTDKKSDIKSLLKFVKTDKQQRVVAATYEEPQIQDLSPQAVYFQTACMQEVSVSQEAGHQP